MLTASFWWIKFIGDFGFNFWISQNTPYSELSVEFILGILFSPLMWIIGVSGNDTLLMGQLLGVKIAALFETAILFDVPPESFDIRPKVQSSFIRLIPRANPMIVPAPMLFSKISP